jgi:hypothetical protein
MDLTQSKLSRQEWNNLETSVSDNEKIILNILIDGYENNDICINKNLSLLEVFKLETIDNGIEQYIYEKYFKQNMIDINKKYNKNNTQKLSDPIKLQKIRSVDMLRLKNIDVDKFKNVIFEYTLIDLYKGLLKSIHKKSDKYPLYVYTIIQILKTKIKNINSVLKNIIMNKVNEIKNKIDLKYLIKNAYTLIEQNEALFKYNDIELYKHQKDVYEIYKNKDKYTPSLVLYTAPTGTGKTLTPIGLSNKYKIIFVCVARHIGLALAKSAISMHKKISFAFGCDNYDQIRLHNFSAKSFYKHDKTGNTCSCNWKNCKATDGSYIKFKDGTKKINHSDGSDVEIMICDVKSYISAMNFMLQFNDKHDIITFWDEPTITLDYKEHELHNIISKNWNENQIPNLILSCATLPKQTLIQPIIDNFKNKFQDAIHYNISSNECKKSIPIINVNQQYISIHNMFDNYNELALAIEHINLNKSLLRYLDLNSIIDFIEYYNKYIIDTSHKLHYNNYFNNDIINITMDTIKNYYLKLLSSISDTSFNKIYTQFPMENNKTVFNNFNKGIQFTTNDAYTLTDGPTIFLSDNVQKIGSFYIQQTKIPENVFKEILAKMGINEKIAKEIEDVEKLIANKEEKNSRDDGEDRKKEDNEDKEWYNKINRLRKQILNISLDSKFVPNTIEHQKLWLDDIKDNRFMPFIDEHIAKEIMTLNIANHYKVLLLMGIGVFVKDINIDYTELMKNLANKQQLFIIIASTDYIYGTNYQFCHGIISKDLETMSQQKTIQSLGRIGRNNIQQNYTVRFRSDNMIYKLFKPDPNNLEANNMVNLFS